MFEPGVGDSRHQIHYQSRVSSSCESLTNIGATGLAAVEQ